MKTDSTATISLIKDKPPDSHPYSSLINDCRLMMTTFARIRMEHVYREANFCADVMAKKGRTLDFLDLVDVRNMDEHSSFVFHSLLNFVSQFLAFDAQGAVTSRPVYMDIS